MISNIHERHLPVPAATAGALIDSLAGPDDRLWPHERWPAMRFDRPLAVGAHGGHGPIRYTVVQHRPGRHVRFRFDAPAGFDGHHEYEVLPNGDDRCTVRYSLMMTTRGPARLAWPLIFGPLHDALMEDSLDKVVQGLGLAQPARSRWSAQVRTLRAAIRAISLFSAHDRVAVSRWSRASRATPLVRSPSC